jgi:hypothetical protein
MLTITRHDGSTVDCPRRWSGRLWRDVPTEDGRRIAPGAITVDRLPVPLSVMTDDGPPECVGTITEVWMGGPGGFGAGFTSLPAGVHLIGIDLGSASIEFDDDWDEEIMVAGTLMGATVYTGNNSPAWDHVSILVEEVPA